MILPDHYTRQRLINEARADLEARKVKLREAAGEYERAHEARVQFERARSQDDPDRIVLARRYARERVEQAIAKLECASLAHACAVLHLEVRERE